MTTPAASSTRRSRSRALTPWLRGYARVRRSNLSRPRQRARAHQARHQGRRRDYPVRRSYCCRHGLAQDGLLGPAYADCYLQGKANIKRTSASTSKRKRFPLTHPEIFKLMGSGHTAGVFQVESAGMTATIKNMKPTEYKHVVASSPCTARARWAPAWFRPTSTV